MTSLRRRLRRPGPRTRSRRADLRARVLAVIAVIALLFSVLVGRLGHLQLADDPTAQAAAAELGTEKVVLPALRGRILDRRGVPLVDNRARTVVTVEGAWLAGAVVGVAAMLPRLGKALDRPVDRLRARTTLCGAPGAAPPPLCWAGSPYVPIPVAEGVDPTHAVSVTETPERFPGVAVTTQAVRSYPRGSQLNAAQVLGYLTRADAATVAASDGAITDQDLVGAAGLEQQYDRELRGTPGERVVRVDPRGVVTEVVRETPPVPGKDLETTLDARVQTVAERALGRGVAQARSRGHRADSGAAVVLDLTTGDVLASASLPTYDPGVWTDGITQARYDELVSSGDRSPLVDRVSGTAYAPASTFKVVSMPAAVATGADLDEPVECSASYRIGDRVFRNFESRAYGRISWHRSMVVSCDTVYYRVAERVWRDQGGLRATDDAGDPLIGSATALGLGQRTGIDLPGEASGRIPGRAWKRDWWEETKDEACRRAKEGYPSMADRTRAAYLRALDRESCANGYQFRAGDQANLSIGQGDMLATPLQMSQVYAAVATGGPVRTPRLRRALVAPDGAREEAPVVVAPGIDAREVGTGEMGDFLRTSLQGVVADGTAKGAFARFPLKRWPVAGKTGTAEVFGKEDTAWFVSYAPADEPRFVVTVTVAQGGTGGDTAAPVAAEIHRELLRITR